MNAKFESSENKWIVLLDDGSEQPEVHCKFTVKSHNSD